jgi:hypothetical protein
MYTVSLIRVIDYEKDVHVARTHVVVAVGKHMTVYMYCMSW